MLATIGYYSPITNDNQVIQGQYHEIVKDPLYIQDITQNLLPIQSMVYPKNEPYEGNPDFYAGEPGVQIYSRNSKHGMSGSGMSIFGRGDTVEMWGKGISLGVHNKPMVGRNTISWGPPTDYEMKKEMKGKGFIPVNDSTMNMPKGPFPPMHPPHIPPPRTPFHRPDMGDISKMTKRKNKYPAERFKSKMARYSKKMKGKGPSIREKRDYIKQLMSRLDRVKA